MASETRFSIAVAGASGFIGAHLCRALEDRFHVVGLARSRSNLPSQIEWRLCDLYSLKELEIALQGIDYAVYLVHSMSPSARLNQAHFEDTDLILADNFARACSRNHVKQIIYLGGLIPSNESKLSMHLQSRKEVEGVLSSGTAALTVLRAGIVVGPGSPSFEMVRKLVEKLPTMLCPKWTQTMTQPVSLERIVRMIIACLGNPKASQQIFDVADRDCLPYIEMLRQTAKVLKLRRWILSVPIFSVHLSRLWLSLITGAPRSLVVPLIRSLRYPMIASHGVQTVTEWLGPGESFEQIVKRTCESKATLPHSYKRKAARTMTSDVRSVQRLPLPAGWNAYRVSKEYLEWLPRLLMFMVVVSIDARSRAYFRFRGMRRPLLILELSKDRSTEDRALFYLRGGLLVKVQGRGRLEFRTFSKKGIVLSAIHDFEPSLPWFVYRYSQAVVHYWVMRSFGWHLSRCA